MKNIIFFSLFFLFAPCSNIYLQPCENYDRWSLESANMNLGIAQLLLEGIADCNSDADRETCYDVYESLQAVDENLVAIVNGNIKNNCMLCDLAIAQGIAGELNQALTDLYNANYEQAWYMSGQASLLIDNWIEKRCPDVSGVWYPNNDPAVTITISYNASDDLFNVEINDGGSLDYTYLFVLDHQSLQKGNTPERGWIWNNGNNIQWSNHEWIRKNDDIEGSWRSEGNVIRIIKTANGRYSLYIDNVVTPALQSAGFTPGDFFGEMWTEDHIHFQGYFITKDVIPRIDMYFKYESRVLHVAPREDVFYDLTGSSKMEKM